MKHTFKICNIKSLGLYFLFQIDKVPYNDNMKTTDMMISIHHIRDQKNKIHSTKYINRRHRKNWLSAFEKACKEVSEEQKLTTELSYSQTHRKIDTEISDPHLQHQPGFLALFWYSIETKTRKQINIHIFTLTITT